MNVDGYSPWDTRLGGLADWDAISQLPNGVAIVCQNSRFRQESVATRYGLRHTMSYLDANPGDFTGFDSLKVLNVAGVDEIAVVYSDSGVLLVEDPPGSGTLVPLLTPVLIPGAAVMQTDKAYNRIYCAFSDLQKGLGTPVVVNGPDKAVAPIAQTPIGGLWTAGRFYQVGDPVRAVDDRWWRCIVPGQASATEPVWPENGYFLNGAFQIPTVADLQGTTQWEEWTPGVSAYLPTPAAPGSLQVAAGSGTIGANLDVYVRCAYHNGFGDTAWSAPVMVRTGGASNNGIWVLFGDSTSVPPDATQGGPRMPRWLAEIELHHSEFVDFLGHAFTLRLFVASVAAGAAAPTQYKQVQIGPAVGNFALDAPVLINSIPATANFSPPDSSSAAISTTSIPTHFRQLPGQVFMGESGTRYMIMLRRDANGSLSPVDPGSAIATDFIQSGAQPTAFLPPGNTTSALNIAAFAVVGADRAGPFFYIAEDFPENQIQVEIETISRSGAVVTAVLNDQSTALKEVAAGQPIIVSGVVDLGFDGGFTIATKTGNTVTWAQTGGDASSTGGLLAVQQQLHSTNDAPSTWGMIPLNFTDDFLAESSDVTVQLTAMAMPPLVDLGFIPSQRKMAYVSDQFPSSILWSQTDDPGTIDGVGGVQPISANDGGRLICVREMRNGQIVAAKTNGGYSSIPSENPPALWGASRLWSDHGPAGPNLLAIGLDFLVFADETGFYRYPGIEDNIDLLSREIPETWKRVNWAQAYRGWITIDETSKVIRIGLPLDDATQPSHELALDYFRGWGRPLTLNTLSGKNVINPAARRWSVNDIPARLSKLVRRTLAPHIDNRIDTSQRLYSTTLVFDSDEVSAQTLLTPASDISPIPTLPAGTYYCQAAQVKANVEVKFSRVFGPFQVEQLFLPGPGGSVLYYRIFEMLLPGDGAEDNWNIYFGADPANLNQRLVAPNNQTRFTVAAPGSTVTPPSVTMYLDFEMPDVYDDNGAGIDWQYEPALTQAAMTRLTIGGFAAHIRGSGLIEVTPKTDDPAFGLPARQIDLGSDGKVKHITRGVRMQTQHGSWLLTNQAIPGAWAEIQEFTTYYRPVFAVPVGA